MAQTIHNAARPSQYGRVMFCLIVAARLFAADPPPDLARRVAARETESAAARADYTYRQTVRVDELDTPGAYYAEAREIVFLPSGERAEKFLRKPEDRLKRLKLTEEDFRDLREIQPMLLTLDVLRFYETKPRGEEDGLWVLEVRPRQVLEGQRWFEGLLWIDPADYSIVRFSGRAVPQRHSTRNENLSPRFTTTRRKVDGHWFAVKTEGEETLAFHNGPLRMRLTVTYTEWKRFQAESSITFR